MMITSWCIKLLHTTVQVNKKNPNAHSDAMLVQQGIKHHDSAMKQ